LEKLVVFKIEEMPNENYQSLDHFIHNDGCDGLMWLGRTAGAYATAQPSP
jgi:hypothetical protein